MLVWLTLLLMKFTRRSRQTAAFVQFSTEGRDGLNWILIDYGSVVVHVFQPEVRSYYRLERLWADAPRVELDIEGAMTSEIPYADLPEDALAPAFELSEDDLVDNLPESADPTE